MSDAVFGRAGPENYDDTIDFADFVFSQAHQPHDFVKVLPKLYKREYFMDGIHYIASEGGKIKAMVGAYPLKYEFGGGIVLPGRGIGAVSVHPRSRSKGYMKVLMNMALEDMKKDGIVFSCLSGRRQRYEYFGYTPAGTNYVFTVGEANIRHTLGAEWKPALTIKPVNSGDKDLLDRIYEIHNAKNEKLYRQKERFFDIISSWGAKVFAFIENGRFEGYRICKQGSFDVSEINLLQPSRLLEALGALLLHRKESGGQESVQVLVGPQDIEKISILSTFAETYRQTPAYQFSVLDFKRFVEPFLKIMARQRVLADGTFVLKIEGENGGTFAVSSKGGKAEIEKTTAAPDLTVNALEATWFFFNPVTAAANPKVRESLFLQSLLPLPLFYENADGV
jgi:predicted acetyltransferase